MLCIDAASFTVQSRHGTQGMPAVRLMPLGPGSALRQEAKQGLDDKIFAACQRCHPMHTAAFFTVQRRHGTQGLRVMRLMALGSLARRCAKRLCLAGMTVLGTVHSCRNTRRDDA